MLDPLFCKRNWLSNSIGQTYHGTFQSPFVQEGSLGGALKGGPQQEGVEIAPRLNSDHHVFFQNPAASDCVVTSCSLCATQCEGAACLYVYTESFRHMQHSVHVEVSEHMDTNPVQLLRGDTVQVQIHSKQVARTIGRNP